MTTTEQTTTGSVLITQNAIEQFLYREARYLDDREFEKWLECYADDAVYWMPAWS
ncbi:MAG: benzoate/toluate 1,2-dioxygenase subunit beta, partial [Frankiaceae bacterium]|nr:benzoate/toluate 1,2-dioxygenase subunit beta [Frankiaceae bacterium]